ncbi:MAG: hypothetical protein V4662_02075 [Verrucomicrobiota bacterium]
MHLKFFIPLFFIITLVAASAGDFTIIKNAGIEGAIVPAEVAQQERLFGAETENFWTPQAKDIELAESKLRAALEKGAKEFPQAQQILKHYNEYRRQYVGLVIKGRRHIFLNSFPSRDTFSDYTKEWVIVYDGGFWFWTILYSVEDSEFSELQINGEA